MNKEIIHINIFYNILDDLLTYLQNEFDELESDILMMKTTIEFAKKSNIKLIIHEFKKYIVPYTKEIFECNEEFFINFEKNLKLTNENILTGFKFKKILIDNTNYNDTEKMYQKANLFCLFQKLLCSVTKIK